MPKLLPIKITFYDATRLAKLGWGGLNDEERESLNGHQLRFILRWLGVSDRGTNEEKRARCALVTTVRQAMLPFPSPTWSLEEDEAMLKNMAKSFSSKQLYGWLRDLGLYRSNGKKIGYCRTLLTWREQCRAKGEDFIWLVNRSMKQTTNVQTKMKI
jgi:hypothetical protein